MKKTNRMQLFEILLHKFYDSMFEEEPGDLGASVHDGDGCEFCEAIPTIFKIMTGIVAQMKDHLQPTK